MKGGDQRILAPEGARSTADFTSRRRREIPRLVRKWRLFWTTLVNAAQLNTAVWRGAWPWPAR